MEARYLTVVVRRTTIGPTPFVSDYAETVTQSRHTSPQSARIIWRRRKAPVAPSHRISSPSQRLQASAADQFRHRGPFAVFMPNWMMTRQAAEIGTANLITYSVFRLAVQRTGFCDWSSAGSAPLNQQENRRVLAPRHFSGKAFEKHLYNPHLCRRPTATYIEQRTLNAQTSAMRDLPVYGNAMTVRFSETSMALLAAAT